MYVTSLHICAVKANISYQTDKDFLARVIYANPQSPNHYEIYFFANLFLPKPILSFLNE